MKDEELRYNALFFYLDALFKFSRKSRDCIRLASRLYEIVTRLMPERASYKCNRRRMAFGVIFQNNARALRCRGRNPRRIRRVRVIHGGCILMPWAQHFKAERVARGI